MQRANAPSQQRRAGRGCRINIYSKHTHVRTLRTGGRGQARRYSDWLWQDAWRQQAYPSNTQWGFTMPKPYIKFSWYTCVFHNSRGSHFSINWMFGWCRLAQWSLAISADVMRATRDLQQPIRIRPRCPLYVTCVHVNALNKYWFCYHSQHVAAGPVHTLAAYRSLIARI